MPALQPAVYFIGAGPGDPELLTLKAQRYLQQADAVVYANSLVPPQILAWANPDAERIPTGSKTLEEIVPLLVARVRAGRSVVRLHSGDLTLYSAMREQVRRLKAAGIRCEFVPGISAFQDAAAKLGAELTVPELVQTIILTRISGAASAMPPGEELAALAAHRASLCLYLAARHVETAQRELLAHYPPETPVAICFRLGWPDEQLWLTSLAELAARSQAANLSRTTLYIISPALADCLASSDAAELGERSQLYHPEHEHLFRPRPTSPAS